MKKKIKNDSKTYSKTISFNDNSLLPIIYGDNDRFLKLIEKSFNVSILTRGNFIKISGDEEKVNISENLLRDSFEIAKESGFLDDGEMHGMINLYQDSKFDHKIKNENIDSLSFTAGKKLIKPRSKKQVDYFNLVKKKSLVFCCGPAGTGKTYLAVALAVSMLKSGQVDKIILSRPAVEAGERLGFLPGDLKEKIDPYLRPLYDALDDMLSFTEVLKKIENGMIEIAPLAFMRGRTLSNAFIILDESQNTTAIQMKMFLTRLGDNSRMIVNGDLSQVDLPSGTKSGLRESINILQDIDDIGFIEFKEKDVVRNPLVSKIVSKYEEFERIQGVGEKYKNKIKND